MFLFKMTYSNQGWQKEVGVSQPPSPVLKISRQNEYFFMPALTQAYNSPSRNREMYRQIGDDELLSDVHSADRVIRR